jgi:putative intracellular protease/amidase
VKGRNVTGFSNAEERATGLTDVVPFLVEDALRANGGNYTSVEDWHPHVVRDGKLITGQNPSSSTAIAEELNAALAEEKASSAV